MTGGQPALGGADPLLEVRDLRVTFDTDAGTVHAVNGVSFSVAPGARVGIVGESGAGKSVAALATMRLVPTPPGRVSGRILFRGEDLMALHPRQLRRIRGKRIAMIFQDPVTCLNPRMTVGDQVVEALRAHDSVPRRAARERAVDLLRTVGIPSPARWADEHPHRLSGGMAQRVMIAIALCCDPELIIADEPTTALDVTIQAQIVELLQSLSEERGMAVLLITHDLALMAGFAERMLVMYAGRVVEEGSVDQIYYGATHPYTRGLIESVPRPDRGRDVRSSPIEGNAPSTLSPPDGCAFHPRCPHTEDVCRDEVPDLTVRPSTDHPSACHFAGELPSAGDAGDAAEREDHDRDATERHRMG